MLREIPRSNAHYSKRHHGHSTLCESLGCPSRSTCMSMKNRKIRKLIHVLKSKWIKVVMIMGLLAEIGLESVRQALINIYDDK